MSDVKTINYEGEQYTFDLEEIDVAQAETIFKKAGLTLLGLENGLGEGNPYALKAVFWLMLQQNGSKLGYDNVNFKIVKFARAMQEADKDGNAEAAPKDDSGEPTQA